VAGLVMGLTLGLLFCFGFEKVQQIYPIMPEEVYRMSNFSTHLEWKDVAGVIMATLCICFLSTLAPAFRGAKLSPVEGLKYE
jgi:lipoprotein-releasing system permease protein